MLSAHPLTSPAVAKKRLKEAARVDDQKVAKKARKLVEDYSQKNSMLRHLQTGLSTGPKAAKDSAPQSLLDIDALLSDRPQEKRSILGRPPMPVVRRPLPPPPMPRFGAMGGMGGSSGMPMFEDEQPYSHDTPEYSMDMSDGFGTPEVHSASPATDFTPDSAPPAEESAARISLSKTTKSLKATAARPVMNDDLKVLPSDGSAGMGGDYGGGELVRAAITSKYETESWLPTGQEYVNMYWLDATEANGVLYLFGKVQVNVKDDKKPDSFVSSFVSCCAVVEGCQRNLFFLPRVKPDAFTDDNTPARQSMANVFKDINAVLVPGILPRVQGAAFKCKPVKRRYAFDHGEIPREETEYMKVVYPAKYGVPNAHQCAGGEHYETIFGAGLSPLELFILKRKLQGPCWITIQKPSPNTDSISHCKVEFTVRSPKDIKVMVNAPPTPPLVSMCIGMKTVVNPSTHVHEIVALSMLVHNKVNADAESETNAHMQRFAWIRPLGLSCGSAYSPQFPHDIDTELRKKNNAGVVSKSERESHMLVAFLNKVKEFDPDVVSSHNLLGFEYDVLLARMAANKVANWSVLGRLRKNKAPKSINDRDAIPGRILCDTYKAAKEFLRETTYSLTHLSASQLKQERFDLDPIDVPRYFSKSTDIVGLAWLCVRDAWLVQQLMFKLQVIPLTKQLTNLSGNLWSRTIKGARAERIEYLLLHEFHTLKYILPERKFIQDPKKGKNAAAMEEEDTNEVAAKIGGMSRKRAKAAYAGGLVLEPKKGLYDTMILLLDFNSLYPSIIQEYNLCFTTIEWTKYMHDTKAIEAAKASKKAEAEGDDEDEEEDGEADDSPVSSLPPLPDSSASPGILPRVIKNLVDRRRQVKNMLKAEKDPAQKQSLDIRQKALKLTANSMYGCLGFSFSRFYARPIAALVTAMGREALQRTVDLATNQMGLDVIYGDTDSVMINTNLTDLQQVKEIGNKVKREVNKLYKSLELDLDGIFRSMLLLKKKKYAALTITELPNGTVEYEKEMKGLDLVRRDWCPLSKNTGKFVVDQILSGKPREDIVLAIHEYLGDLAANIRNNSIPMEEFIITKGLNKNPKDYPDCNGQAHLQVALQMLKANKPVNIGDHIPYVICNQTVEGAAAANSMVNRAHHPDDVVRSKGELTVDYEWYLSTQILPPVSRLCEPIEGTSAAIISERLGLDASKYARASAGDDAQDDAWGFTPQCQLEDSERFKGCVPLVVVCSSCNKECSVRSVMDLQEGGTLLNCSQCGSLYFGRNSASDVFCYLSNRITLLVRDCVRKYYDCWLICDDPSCGQRTMQQSVVCTADNCHGRTKQEFDELALHTQLKYLESLFDVKRYQARKSVDDKTLLTRLSKDQLEVLRLLREHMSNSVKGSAYNWIRPSLWSALFGKLSGNGPSAKSLM